MERSAAASMQSRASDVSMQSRATYDSTPVVGSPTSSAKRSPRQLKKEVTFQSDDVRESAISAVTVSPDADASEGIHNRSEFARQRERLRKQQSKVNAGLAEEDHKEGWGTFMLARTKSQKLKQKYGKGHKFPRVRRLVLWWPFEVYHGIVICANCVSIGYVVDHDELQGTLTILLIENYFTFTFFTELVLRTMCNGWTFPLLKENHLDVFLVSLSVLNTWILGPAGVDPGILKKLTVLRILRLVRLARSLRFRPEFHDMWQLMRGLVESSATLFWCYVMISCVLYFFAIVGVSTIGKAELLQDEDTEHGAAAQEYFGSLMLSMLTLFQVMTIDSWSGVMRAMMGEQPLVVCFFVFFISVSVFILTNLIIAVIVENAFDSAEADQQELAKELELQREQELEELGDIFRAMDLDGSGKVDRDELVQAMHIRHVRLKLRILDVTLEDLSALWEILDDGDGELDVDEFMTGMRRMKGEGKAKDVMRLMRELRIQEATAERLDNQVQTSVARLAPMREKVRRNVHDLEALRRTLTRANTHLKHAAKCQVLTHVEDSRGSIY